jgi:DNA invertase Pin-like site-specific DNA recombinase
VNELHIGLKGTMGALFLRDLADKTRRGLRGRVEAGKSGGGNSFGYDVVRRLDADGLPVRGERKINAAEAGIVRRRFNDYAGGKAPQAIAKQLNKEAVPGPSGTAWGPSTRHRHPQQRTLCRQAGLEPAALHQGPGNRQARLAPEPGVRMDTAFGRSEPDRPLMPIRSGLN